MKAITAVAFAIASVSATAAHATGPLAESAGKITRIEQGHGQPGDSAVASSDKSVTFEVLPDGRVRRTNAKYNTVSISDPVAEARRFNRR
ncbi:hypothetical protein G6M64_08970 [Agrobacterium tumefaciens]|uniref:hypothetical protein n=1 Tax=Agrobacterium tumefaciens TaxID=358 RepID=UPI001573A1FD|nr:hypothetical protein [Agrobacterium tumefaciens]NSZ03280.1 hypothetical protein [Agrobacterium tumefaciens]NSZ36662.1 hypothetical protein [Agrobacterium tumefaciens]NTA84768.1 hypothetical protein [Agrobacterium tumefaciens]NTB24730.1 hypothetical protein [Agrobacterium tumefaciens]NTB27524.1 hypothetical protein [Agrobacterium tumefaciens]